MSVQKFDHKSLKVMVAGVSGTGKTTLFEKLIKAEKSPRKIFFDHQGEFSTRFGIKPIYFADELPESLANGGNVCYDPIKEFPGKTPEAFAFFCDLVFEIIQSVKGRKIFVCDEIQILCDAHEMPEGLMKILDTGRRYQCDCFFITNALNGIHNRLRNQITKLHAFRMVEKNSLKFCDENGFDSEKIRSLKNGEYVWRDFNSGETGEGGKAF
jgi:GTPase SAR1 family protein